MLHFNFNIRPWLVATLACLLPASLQADDFRLLNFQDAPKAPAAAPPEGTGEATPMPKAEPKPMATSEATPMAKPAAPAKEADGVAHVRNAGCRPGAGCGPNRRTAGCNNGNCGPGGCNSAGCNSYGSMADGMICAGRPYTVGDLNADLCSIKHRCMNGLGCNSYQGGALHSWWCEHQFRSQCRRAYRNRVLGAWFKNKFNYFIPGGCCGQGCKPIGSYSRVYAADPNYYDSRDTQIYASPATGVPTAIPLAPNVRYQYNYSWGYPGSRLTPISTFRPTR